MSPSSSITRGNYPKYGYYPEVDKCIVIHVVDSNHETEARSAFEHLGVKVVKGYRFLGGFIGDHDSTKAFIQKIMELTNSVVKLSKLAESQPQEAFSALAKSLQFEWSYLQRILPNFDDKYVPIQDAVNQMFWPAVFADTHIQLRASPVYTSCMNMGVRNPVETSTSRAGTSNIVDGIKDCKQFLHPITPSKCLKQHQLCTMH